MLDSIPLKQSHLIAGFTVILILLSIKFAFQRTATAWQLNNQLTAKLEQSFDITYQPDYLEQKNKNLDKIVDLYKVDTSTYRTDLLATLSAIAEKENVKIIEVPQSGTNPYYQASKFNIQKLVLEGSFVKLTEFFNKAQLVRNIGIIRSVDYVLGRGNLGAGSRNGLSTTIYIQSAR